MTQISIVGQAGLLYDWTYNHYHRNCLAGWLHVPPMESVTFRFPEKIPFYFISVYNRNIHSIRLSSTKPVVGDHAQFVFTGLIHAQLLIHIRDIKAWIDEEVIIPFNS